MTGDDELLRWRESLPAALRALLADAPWHEVTLGWSGVRVFHVAGAGYLKIATRPEHDLRPEKERLDWLRGRLPAPEVRYFAAEPGRQMLLISAIGGLPSCDEQFRDGRQGEVVTLLGRALRDLHALEIKSCPFDRRADALLAEAQCNVVSGLVDESAFDAGRQGRSPQSLYAELLATRPAREELVFAHGDYCMPNILIDASALRVTGFVDWGRAGVADRYLDLALAARSITVNWGAEWVPTFFAAYGLPPAQVDAERIAFFQLLDEFF